MSSPPPHLPRGSLPRCGPRSARLAGRLCPHSQTPGLTDIIRAALVLLADHELAASTLAARVAASVRAEIGAAGGQALPALADTGADGYHPGGAGAAGRP